MTVVLESADFVNAEARFAVAVPFFEKTALFASVTAFFTSVFVSPCESTGEVNMAAGLFAVSTLSRPATRTIAETAAIVAGGAGFATDRNDATFAGTVTNRTSEKSATGTMTVVLEGADFVNAEAGLAVAVPFFEKTALFAGVTAFFAGVFMSPCESTGEINMTAGLDADSASGFPSTRTVTQTNRTDFAGATRTGSRRSCQRKKEKTKDKKENDVVLFHETLSVECR
jgi:hypothetical protein